MIRRKVFRILPIVSLVALLGCEKKSPPAEASVLPASSTEASALAEAQETGAILRIHWLGSKRIAADRSAAGLVKILDTAESARLKAQTLDKLATALGRLLTGETNQTSTNSLRPLLDDMVAQECYLEVRHGSNSPSASDEIVLAVRLDAERTNLWQTELAPIVDSHSKSPQSSSYSGSIEFVRSGGWSLISAAHGHNSLSDEIVGRIQRNHTPVISSSTNDWIEGNIDLSQFVGVDSNAILPKVSFAMKGDGTNVITTGELVFPDSEPLKFDSWNIPTNLIPSELASFTAVRGLRPWLGALRFWTELQAGSAPDQLYVWALQGSPMQTYFATPMADASNVVNRISDLALKKEGPPRVTNVLAGFERSKTFNGLSWRGFPYFTPFLESSQIDARSFAIGGFMQVDRPPGPPPPGLVESIVGHTNLIYYDRETTGLRIEQWIHLGQAIRFVSGAAQLPGDSASFAWLRAMIGRTGSCGTEITQISPTRLSFARRSDTGFSAFELHLLADWLESPDFPRGTYSSLAPLPVLPGAP